MAQHLEDLETAAAGEHEIQNHQVEQLRIGVEKAVFASLGNHYVVVLRPKAFGQRLSQLRFVLDDEDPHRMECYESPRGVNLTSF